MRYILILSLIFLLPPPSTAQDIAPIEALRNGVEKGIRVLNDPTYREPNRKAEQLTELRKILEQLFDFEVFSRKVLAAHWKKFSPAQREMFVAVFTEFLGKYYMEKLQERYQDERVNYLSQTLNSPTRALVRAEVIWKGNHIQVDLRMIKRAGDWKIYDIQVVGISALSIYRAQFKSLLKRRTPAQVIALLHEKIRILDLKRQAGGT